MANAQTAPTAPFFVQEDTRIRQSNTNAGFLAFGDVITLGQKDFPSGRDHTRPEPTNAPPTLPAGTGWYVHVEIATADHFNLFLIACQLPDGTACGMALRPKAYAKLRAASLSHPPVGDGEVVDPVLSPILAELEFLDDAVAATEGLPSAHCVWE